jgi:hypothetical protein
MSEVISVNKKTGEVVLTAADVEAVPDTEVGQPNGVATLNSGGKLLETQLPSSVANSSAARSAGEGYVWSGTEWTPETLVSAPTGSNTVLGSEAMPPTAGTKNTALGAASLQANTTGKENTAVGARSLNANTEGAGNTALGVNALEVSTTGVRNTAIGVDALQANNAGSENVALGSGSLKANTEGEQNVAIGCNSMKAATTNNSKNVAVGQAALENNAATHNTAVGNVALKENTSGECNTALGSTALQKNKTGEHNTAVGYEAMVLNESGDKNTALGYAALNENKTGAENTAVGVDAMPGKGGTLKSRNTALGYKAGFEAEGEGNVFIGVEAGAKEKGSDKLYIANSNTTEPLLLGDFAAKILTINGAIGGKEVLGVEQLKKPAAKPAAPTEGGEATIGEATPGKKVTALLKGNGSKTSYVITHGLKTRFVQVSVYATTGEEPTEEMVAFAGKIFITGAEKVELKFATPPPAEVFAVVVSG